MKKRSTNNVYALYKGDKYIAGGTLDELVKITGLKRKTLFFYECPAYKRRCHGKNYKVLIRLD